MRLEYLALLTLLGCELRSLVRERERWFADEREDDLRLVALMDILLETVPLSDTRGG